MINTARPTNHYLRQVGVLEEVFTVLLSRLTYEIEEEIKNNPMKKRGIRSKVMTTEIKLLLTLTYLRHYPTFISLGAMFGISESYANKIFHKTVNHLLKFIHPRKTGELSLDDVRTVIVDATEQGIERPVAKQQPYYSGKKNDIL